ncbi:unnamed protein product [Dimorphilus gyrociliatus]|uniref:Innexin n=1 Tax=Dimorphilus gyrociliatus TaxID=2664684 RepID=A0A7I8WD68_9ANNE|nr:unnamed protein product [Dimorphilus gyrociliatus]
MDKIVKVVKGASKGDNVKRDDDWADRLSSRYTVAIIVAFAIIVSGQQYFIGKPLNCWEPKHFTGSHKKYMNSYCWVKNTYYLPFDDYIPREHENEKRRVLPYYQWIPFILLGQALFFYIPSFVWHGLNDRAGVDSDDILKTAHKIADMKEKKKREETLTFLSKQIHRFLTATSARKGENNSTLNKIKSAVCSRRFSGYLLMIFLFSKVLYAANVIIQLLVLNKILGTKYGAFGIDFLKGKEHADHWMSSASHTFPTVTMCDFFVRRLGNVHRYSVQCVLPINMYNEKIYVFLWFWFMMVAVITVLNFLTWLIRSILPSDKLRYIKNHLATARFQGELADEKIKYFVTKYLRSDGIFLIRLIGHNCNFITTNDITAALWKEHIQNLPPEEKSNGQDQLIKDTEDV